MLADWGAADLGERRPTDALRAHWFAIPLLRQVAELAAPGEGTIDIQLDEGTFHIMVNGAGPSYAHGPAEHPDARLTLDGDACLAVSQGRASLPELIKKGRIAVDGGGPLAHALRGE